MATIDPRKISVAAAAVALVAAAAALALLAALHVLSPEFSPAWRMVSEYADGRYPSVLSAMFVAYGLSSLALAFAIRSQLVSRSGRMEHRAGRCSYPCCTTAQGVNGLDFGRVARGSEPRKATMISLTMRCKPTTADVTSQQEVALAA